MYPNIIITFNIAANTMIGKLIIGKDGVQMYTDLLNADDIDSIMEDADLGAEFVDDLQTGDILTLARKWFGLPDIDTVIDIVQTELVEIAEAA